MLLAPIIFLAILSNSFNVWADNVLQLRLSENLSIYSEKAYRRDNGAYFEAVGNVVISSGKDTLYGEKASFNTKSGEMLVEGSVRFIGKNVTLYGSKISYNIQSELLILHNARMITPEFSIVASKLTKKSEKIYLAEDAEFTTCKDCTESWVISGKDVHIEVGEYIQLYHALLKAKGIDVLYLPYIALPIKSTRESGLIYPRIYTRNDEGVFYEQPIFWAINNSKDMTFTPKFLSERGYGLNYEYRQVFGEKRWVEFKNNLTVDEIYLPNKTDSDPSGERFFRDFYELESHYQYSNSLSQHLNIMGLKDLDYLRFLAFNSDKVESGNDLGLDFFVDKRMDRFSFGVETQYKRNLLAYDSLGFDPYYVQTLPSVYFSMMPTLLWQYDSNYFYKLSFGLSGDITSFRQNRFDETNYLRNVNRLDTSPYLDLNILSVGPVTIKSKYQMDYQAYKFLNEDDPGFYKNSGLVSTELSFTVDRIFGLAYKEQYRTNELSDSDLEKISDVSHSKERNSVSKAVVGSLPPIDSSISQESINVSRSSYRHSQEYKFIHHKLVHHGEAGNNDFLKQIGTQDGWFDYRDAITKDILELQSNETRTQIPLKNTLEFQWNNVLIRKTSRNTNYLLDDRYLKDNFTYHKLGYFNISQGIDLADDDDASTIEERLTRLLVDTGYQASSWNFNFKDSYKHQTKDHILSLSGQKRFTKLSMLAKYNYNSFSDSNLKTMMAGAQYRPIDILGFSVLNEYDLKADENISLIYQVDFMPHNNCWLVNFNYKDTFVAKRFSINFEFNFGNDEFKNYRNNFFSYARLGR